MPTLNASYNLTLIEWARQGHASEAECECCECDLTGEHVVETPINWVCVECADAAGFDANGDEHEEEHCDWRDEIERDDPYEFERARGERARNFWQP